MITLQNVFSDGALFQADAPLTLRGRAAAGEEITARLTGGKGEGARAAALCDGEGRFALTLHTPGASFDRWEITLCCAGEQRVMADVLFGELWLASGQSNMEVSNSVLSGARELYARAAERQLRVFHVEYPAGESFPWDPEPMGAGRWISGQQGEALSAVSAVGLMCALEVYDGLNRDREVPVGFLNASWGGTGLRGWLPREDIEGDEAISALLRAQGSYPDREQWNSRGANNFQQTAAMYNVKIAPLEGLRVRGVLWYQGENETAGESRNRSYGELLRFYHRVYARRFAADPQHFMMVSSLIYPWTYGPSGECGVGYLNQAFVQTADSEPDRFAAVPIGDLQPTWFHHHKNHPIHPALKYPLGRRMARAVLSTAYGLPCGQSRPASLESFRREGSRLALTFRHAGSGLFVDGDAPVGLYAAGEDGVYLPARCRCEGDTLWVWCDEIAEPVHAAYSVQSMEPACNLWAGDYPIMPFMTDQGETITIQARPWYDTSRTAMWGMRIDGEINDVFYRPVFYPDGGSILCPDRAFTLEKQSLRVEGEGHQFGCHVRAWPYYELDLERFSRLTMNLYNHAGTAASLVLEWEDGALERPFALRELLDDGWAAMEVSLEGIPQGRSIRRMHLRFVQDGCRYPFVNLEKLRLHK